MFVDPAPVRIEYVPTPPAIAPGVIANDEEQPAPPVREIERQPDGVAVVAALSPPGFWVSRVRDNGTTYAGAHFTRQELVMLRDRIDEALK
jgi:hypothetical protein